jgi:hypothetical protein
MTSSDWTGKHSSVQGASSERTLPEVQWETVDGQVVILCGYVYFSRSQTAHICRIDT